MGFWTWINGPSAEDILQRYLQDEGISENPWDYDAVILAARDNNWSLTRLQRTREGAGAATSPERCGYQPTQESSLVEDVCALKTGPSLALDVAACVSTSSSNSCTNTGSPSAAVAPCEECGQVAASGQEHCSCQPPAHAANLVEDVSALEDGLLVLEQQHRTLTMTESLPESNVHNHPSSLTQPCHTSEAAAVHRPAADSEGSHAPCEAESPPATHHNPGDDGEHVIEAQQQSLPEDAKVQDEPASGASGAANTCVDCNLLADGWSSGNISSSTCCSSAELQPTETHSSLSQGQEGSHQAETSSATTAPITAGDVVPSMAPATTPSTTPSGELSMAPLSCSSKLIAALQEQQHRTLTMTESLSEGNVHNHPSSLTQPCHTSEAAAVHRPAADSEGSHAPCEAESPPAAHHNPGDDGEHVIEAQQQSLPEEAKVQVHQPCSDAPHPSGSGCSLTFEEGAMSEEETSVLDSYSARQRGGCSSSSDGRCSSDSGDSGSATSEPEEDAAAAAKAPEQPPQASNTPGINSELLSGASAPCNSLWISETSRLPAAEHVQQQPSFVKGLHRGNVAQHILEDVAAVDQLQLLASGGAARVYAASSEKVELFEDEQGQLHEYSVPLVLRVEGSRNKLQTLDQFQRDCGVLEYIDESLEGLVLPITAGMWLVTEELSDEGEVKGSVVQLMPRCERSWESVLQSDWEQGLSQDYLWSIARYLITLLCEANRYGIVFTDIKPANMVLTGSGDTLLIDYSDAVVKGMECPSVTCRSLAYCAAEVRLDTETTRTAATAVAEAGATLFAMAVGKRRHQYHLEDNGGSLWPAERYKWLNTLDDIAETLLETECDETFIKLVLAMLHCDLGKRKRAEQLRDWMTQQQLW